MEQFTVTFIPSGRGNAQCPPNPDYPHGIDVAPPISGPSCKVTLPYPAPECGLHHVLCNLCGLTVAVTAAGRPDDPISVTVPCATTQRRGNAPD